MSYAFYPIITKCETSTITTFLAYIKQLNLQKGNHYERFPLFVFQITRVPVFQSRVRDEGGSSDGDHVSVKFMGISTMVGFMSKCSKGRMIFLFSANCFGGSLYMSYIISILILYSLYSNTL